MVSFQRQVSEVTKVWKSKVWECPPKSGMCGNVHTAFDLTSFPPAPQESLQAPLVRKTVSHTHRALYTDICKPESIHPLCFVLFLLRCSLQMDRLQCRLAVLLFKRGKVLESDVGKQHKLFSVHCVTLPDVWHVNIPHHPPTSSSSLSWNSNWGLAPILWCKSQRALV